ncbi:hypothetical protein [Salinicola acroporae]|uniref:N-acetyltransferase domain-containing protein n=1 Tax=Salinicola acroporae TaxID=1541440 RepID=A0ABT6I567_9GAMM|nr:hypothetical protein [Salinicola acroporae]MDH4572828.1 hypothetical protein [Salinicola acroporae]
MKVVHVKNPEIREACLAKLCASVYGQEAGLAPLVTFAGTQGVLFEQEAARLFALTEDDGTVLCLALISSDVDGGTMEVGMLSTPEGKGDTRHSRHLVKTLAEKAPLRVTAADEAGEAFFRRCGIERWVDGEGGLRIGLGPLHPTPVNGVLPSVVRFNGDGIVRTFKQEPETFEAYKSRFVAALERYSNIA